MRRSAGILLHREVDGRVEVLLGHMGGPLWARKEAGAWTIPKGELADGEDPHAAAVREFTEEIGCPPPPGAEIDLGTVRQRGGKLVTAWGRRGDLDVTTITSNPVEMEWPPRSGRRIVFPELDRASWLPIDAARTLVVAGQVPLLDALEEALRGPSPDGGPPRLG